MKEADYLSLSSADREDRKYCLISQAQAFFTRMPTAQIAYILYLSQSPALASIFETKSGWRANYRARHYLASLAMQTANPTRPEDVCLNDVVDAGALVWEIMTANAIDIAIDASNTSNQGQLVLQINEHRRWNQRMIDVEQMRERCLSLFDSMPADDNGLGCKSAELVVFLDLLAAQLEHQNLFLKGATPPKCWHTLRVPLTYMESLAGTALITRFGLVRGERDDQLRFADTTNGWCLTEERPLFVDEKWVYVPDMNALWHAVYNRLLRSSVRYSKLREVYSETRVGELLRALFGSNCVTQTVWEKKDAFEHDALVIYGDALVAVEVKGTVSVPPVWPNHSQTALRAHKHVAEDSSVFKALRQAQNFIKFLETRGNTVTLRVGPACNTHMSRFDLSAVQRKYAIAVSLEEYGSLTTDWGTLNAVERETGKPWAIDLHSFEQFVWGLKRRGWDGADLLVYLDDRAKAHGSMETFDELDFAGYWLKFGDLKLGISHIGENYASIFDELWLERRGQGSVQWPDVIRPSRRPPTKC